MRNLPPGWVTASLKGLVAPDGIFSDGNWIESKDQDPNGGIRLLQLADIGDGLFLDKSERYINEAKLRELRCTEVFEGDVLVARMPEPLGRACLLPKMTQRCITVVDVAIIRPGSESVCPAWLMYILNAPKTRLLIDMLSSGTTRRRVSRRKLSEIDVPVAPLGEQRRIADKLDALFVRLNACRKRLDGIPLTLKRFRQSVLAAAVSGQLTTDLREGRQVVSQGEEDILESCRLILLQDVIKCIKTGPFGSALHTSDYVKGGIPIVNPMHINGGRITPSDNMTISKSKVAKLSEFVLNEGDVIIARRGTMGRCAVIGQREDGWLCGTGSMLLRPSDVLVPHYLQIFLSSPATVATLEASAVGSTMVNLNQRILLGLKVSLPSIGEQQEIVRRVKALFAYADRLEAHCAAARVQVEHLAPTLLAQAYHGRLAPQNPSDEPASMLLERIGTLRAAESKMMRGDFAATASSKSETRVAETMLRRNEVRTTHLSDILRDQGRLTAEALWSASQLSIDDFYDQMKAEEELGLLKELRGGADTERLLEANT